MALHLPPWICAALIALPTLAAAAVPARPETLNLLIWESYISPVVIDRWKALTHTDINQIYFDNGDKRDLLLSNPGTLVDLAVIESARIDPLARNGLLAALHRQGRPDPALPNLALIDPQWGSACGPYGAAYFWGTNGILYRSDRLAAAPASWLDLLRPAAALHGHVAMLKDDDDILAAPLGFLKKPTDTDNIEDLRQAFAILKAQAPYVLTYDYVITAEQEPEFNHKIYMALGYTGDQLTLNRNAGSNAWHFVTPHEGSVIWTDCLAVVDRSPRRKLALEFIDFVNRPENAAENALYLKLPTPNLAARRLLPKAMLDDPEIYPPAGVVAHSQFRRQIPAATLQLRRRIVSVLVSSNDTQ